MLKPRFRYEADLKDEAMQQIGGFTIYDSRKSAGSHPFCTIGSHEKADMITNALNLAHELGKL